MRSDLEVFFFYSYEPTDLITARYSLVERKILIVKGTLCTKFFVIIRRSHGDMDSVWTIYKSMWKTIKILGIMRVFPLTMFFFDTGAILGGHVRAVFTLITFIFTICVALTVTSFKEIPLHLLERQEQVRGDDQKTEGL
jgi:hypothetical protein